MGGGAQLHSDSVAEGMRWEAGGRSDISVQPKVPTDRPKNRPLGILFRDCRIVAKHSSKLKLAERAVGRKNRRTTILMAFVFGTRIYSSDEFRDSSTIGAQR